MGGTVTWGRREVVMAQSSDWPSPNACQIEDAAQVTALDSPTLVK